MDGFLLAGSREPHPAVVSRMWYTALAYARSPCSPLSCLWKSALFLIFRTHGTHCTPLGGAQTHPLFACRHYHCTAIRLSARACRGCGRRCHPQSGGRLSTCPSASTLGTCPIR